MLSHSKWVIEFGHPTRKANDGAKSHVLDAVRAAREVLGQKRTSVPRAAECAKRSESAP